MPASETIRGVNGRDKITADIRHRISSSKASPEAAIRRHRVDRERAQPRARCRQDACRVRERHAARNMAKLRRVALDLARAKRSLTASLKGKRKCAARDAGFMAKPIAG